ncbi:MULTISPECIES: hypothetical protein [unclassified Streptomyces]|uniref:hypothetical protein n=1 Tax=unclassified Streptomyces TaxID=2593676 RepID=UPI00114D0584|nr:MULTISPECIES: hypothetical protein [unclassified Streptomyces]MYT13346.1 hypothetical protein [Streptomyces sp. SID4951]
MELPEFDELFAESDPEALGSGQQIGFDDAWILQLQPAREGDLVIELGSASPLFNVVAEQGSRMASTPRNRRPLPGGHGRFISLRIEGVDAKRHDDALRILREVSDALFFELDLEYGAVPRLAHSRDAERIRHGNVPLRMAFTKDVPKNPRNKYAEKPLSLYWYGRSARQIPLLQYLAYYQVLEFYFPTYSQRDALTRIRNELLDPRFRAGDDMSLMRIMHLSAGFGKGFGSEREQLRSTVAGCVTEAHLRDFIDANDDLSQHFSGVQKIKGVAHIDVADKRNDLMTSVANRIYDIRCRIVHAKEDGGGGSADLLLPFSEEAYSLHPDIELVRFIAQKALIAGAVQL